MLIVQTARCARVSRPAHRQSGNPGTDSAPDALATINRLPARTRRPARYRDDRVGRGRRRRSRPRRSQDGVDHLFVCGGDGTLNEVINGVAAVPGGLDAVSFGIIPLGTGNDFATAMGLAADVEESIPQLFEREAAQVDLGRLNGRAFVNVSAGGFIAEVSDAVSEPLKTVAGRLAYLLGGAQVVFSYTPVRATIQIDGATASLELQTFAVCNSRLVGGGRLIAPHARPDDGLLDVCLIEAMPTVEFIALLRQVAKGEHLDDPRVTYFQSASPELSFDRTIKINTDGEVHRDRSQPLRDRAARGADSGRQRVTAAADRERVRPTQACAPYLIMATGCNRPTSALRTTTTRSWTASGAARLTPTSPNTSA